jgi:transcriptional regulator with XRE-family HTH domain
VSSAGDFERFKQAVGGRIQRRRKELGLTQERLAEIAEVDRKHISSIETGKAEPGTWTVFRIAGALQTTDTLLMAGLSWVPSEHGPGRFEQEESR